MRKYGTISLALSLCIHLLAWLLYVWLQSTQAPEQPRRIALGNLKLETLPNTQTRAKSAASATPSQQAPLSAQQPAPQTPQTPAQQPPEKAPQTQRPQNAQNPQAKPNAPSNTAAGAPPSFYQLLQEDVQSPWQELYGDEVRSLSKEDKAYLDENYRKIYTITQRNLRYPQEAGRLGLQGVNRVEFFLQPNGDITDLRITSSSGYEMFDKNSLRTIEISYKDYPRPKKPLKIIFYIHYKISY